MKKSAKPLLSISSATPPGSVSASQQRHQIIGAPLHLRHAPRCLEAVVAPGSLLAGLAHDDLAFAVHIELDAIAGSQVQRLPHLRGDGDLPLGRRRRDHPRHPRQRARTKVMNDSPAPHIRDTAPAPRAP
eukprot:TRINITY_DN3502_c0_g3_i3.p3 TRINITY_DN3502_c0_g3~~TRINITY_DN3502_c0_g3_i3.p3  ORF type:complete len:130 (-),score=12.49 TRINITY_DN3502_c0_g3_i3:81-470(-)